MAIKPLGDRLAVKAHEQPEMSAGGIFVGQMIDDGLVKEIVRGTVVAVGPGLADARGVVDSMWELKAGDVVEYSPVCCHTQIIDGEKITLIRSDAVVGVVE